VKRPKHNLIRMLPPEMAALDYHRAIVRLACVPARASFHKVRNVVLKSLAILRARQVRGDARFDASGATEKKRAVALVEEARGSFTPDTKALAKASNRFGQRTADFHENQFAEQARNVGISTTLLEDPVKGIIPNWVKENVDLIKTVPERYFDRLRGDVEAAFSSGMRVETLASAFEDDYGTSKNDAARIARDQVGKLNATVNQARQEALGATKYVWRTMNDQRVRDEHSLREGEEFSWDDPPEGGHPGEDILCFPGNSRISLFHSNIMKTYRYWYKGELTSLITNSGETLNCTPNHPILTSRGWVAAHLVNVGDYVFKTSREGFDSFVDDPKSRDTPIEQIFRAASILYPIHRVRASAVGFHGDGSDKDIDVINVDGNLRFKLDAACSQRFCQDLLILANAAGFSLGHEYFCFLRSRHASNGSMGGFRQRTALLMRHPTISLEHGLGPIARLDSIAHQLSFDGRAADAETFRQSLNAPTAHMKISDHVSRILFSVWRRAINPVPGFNAPTTEQLTESVSTTTDTKFNRNFRYGVSLLQQRDSIIKKIISENYSGHVYNLQTTSGWYVTQNLIVSNCRCYAEPIYDLD